MLYCFSDHKNRHLLTLFSRQIKQRSLIVHKFSIMSIIINRTFRKIRDILKAIKNRPFCKIKYFLIITVLPATKLALLSMTFNFSNLTTRNCLTIIWILFSYFLTLPFNNKLQLKCNWWGVRRNAKLILAKTLLPILKGVMKCL